MSVDFEWMEMGEGWELADDDSLIGGQVVPFPSGPGGYVGIAELHDRIGRTFRTVAVGRFQTPAVTMQAVEEKLTEWYEEEQAEALMEQRLYEQEQGWRR